MTELPTADRIEPWPDDALVIRVRYCGVCRTYSQAGSSHTEAECALAERGRRNREANRRNRERR